MSNPTRKSFKKTFDYPEVTRGSSVARQIREKTNSLTDEQREEYFKRGMQIIYGAVNAKQTASV